MTKKKHGYKKYFIWLKTEPVLVRGYTPEAAIGWYFRKEHDKGNMTDDERSSAANACIDMYHENILPVTYRNPAARRMIGKSREDIAKVVAYDISFGKNHSEKFDDYFQDMMERPLGHLMHHCQAILFKNPKSFEDVANLTVSS